MNELTPADVPHPEGDSNRDVPPNGHEQEAAQHQQSRRRKAGQILDEQQCLAGMSQLLGLLAIGLIKPQTSNAMRGLYHDLLLHYQRSGRDAAKAPLADEDLLAILRENPAMLSMLESLISDEQLQLIMGEATDGQQQT